MPAVILRVLALIALAGVSVLILRRFFGAGAPPRPGTFRPRGKWPGGPPPAEPPRPQERFVLTRESLFGLRDPYSGAMLEPEQALLRCAGCQSVYHAESADELRKVNGGRCVSCGGTRFNAVEVVD